MLDPLSVEILRMVWPPFPMMEPTTELSTSMSKPPGCFEALVRPGACSWRMEVNWRGAGGRDKRGGKCSGRVVRPFFVCVPI